MTDVGAMLGAMLGAHPSINPSKRRPKAPAPVLPVGATCYQHPSRASKPVHSRGASKRQATCYTGAALARPAAGRARRLLASPQPSRTGARRASRAHHQSEQVNSRAHRQYCPCAGICGLIRALCGLGIWRHRPLSALKQGNVALLRQKPRGAPSIRASAWTGLLGARRSGRRRNLLYRRGLGCARPGLPQATRGRFWARARVKAMDGLAGRICGLWARALAPSIRAKQDGRGAMLGAPRTGKPSGAT